MKTRIIIVGGGSSGLMAACTAAEAGAEVTLLEQNPSLGKKLLLTGGGRCNVTNNRPEEEIIRHIPGNGKFLHSSFTQFSQYDIMTFFSFIFRARVTIVRMTRMKSYRVPLNAMT